MIHVSKHSTAITFIWLIPSSFIPAGMHIAMCHCRPRTWSRRLHRRSSPGARPAPRRTTPPWQSLSRRCSALRPSWCRPPEHTHRPHLSALCWQHNLEETDWSRWGTGITAVGVNWSSIIHKVNSINIWKGLGLFVSWLGRPLEKNESNYNRSVPPKNIYVAKKRKEKDL